jgi:hypothetical protein
MAAAADLRVNASRHRIAHYVGKHGKQVVKIGTDFNYFITY